MKSTSKPKTLSRAKRPRKVNISVRKDLYRNEWLGGYVFPNRDGNQWGAGGDNIPGATRDTAVFQAMVAALRRMREGSERLADGNRMPDRIEFVVTGSGVCPVDNELEK